MDIPAELRKIGLHSDNAVVIGSGILSTLAIRDSNDIDVVVDPATYAKLKRTGRFAVEQSYGEEVLTGELFEIRTGWGVLGKEQTFEDLARSSVIIEGTRYITPEYLLAVKRHWLKDGNARPKDINDVKLIEAYLKDH